MQDPKHAFAQFSIHCIRSRGSIVRKRRGVQSVRRDVSTRVVLSLVMQTERVSDTHCFSEHGIGSVGLTTVPR